MGTLSPAVLFIRTFDWSTGQLEKTHEKYNMYEKLTKRAFSPSAVVRVGRRAALPGPVSRPHPSRAAAVWTLIPSVSLQVKQQLNSQKIENI